MTKQEFNEKLAKMSEAIRKEFGYDKEGDEMNQLFEDMAYITDRECFYNTKSQYYGML